MTAVHRRTKTQTQRITGAGAWAHAATLWSPGGHDWPRGRGGRKFTNSRVTNTLWSAPAADQEVAEPELVLAEEAAAAVTFSEAPDDADFSDGVEESEALEPEDLASERESLR